MNYTIQELEAFSIIGQEIELTNFQIRNIQISTLDFERGHFEKPLESYSDGQKKKVLIAGNLCQQAHLYV